MVDDCSTDKSPQIIDEFDNKYECCRAIHLKENMGSANGPRNVGIKESTGNYLMFMDNDDAYTPDACETLYKTMKENDVDIVYGRYRRTVRQGKSNQKSYSPYKDNLELNYPNETIDSSKYLEVPDFIYDNIIKKILYGSYSGKKYNTTEKLDFIKINNINEEPDLLTMPPAVWNKLFKKELIVNNNIKFQPFIIGEDLSFVHETFLKANGIILLNSFFAYNYYVRDDEGNESISNTANFKLLNDLMKSYIYCRNLTKNSSKDIQNSINSHLLYWIKTWQKSELTKEENKLLLEKAKELQKIHTNSPKGLLLIKIIIQMIKVKV